MALFSAFKRLFEQVVDSLHSVETHWQAETFGTSHVLDLYRYIHYKDKLLVWKCLNQAY